MSGKKLVVSLVLAAALMGAVPAMAAEATPESYKEAVEPICKSNTEANEKILKGVRGKVNAGKLDAAAKQVRAAARALKQARIKLVAVPKPADDAARLTKWLGYVKTEVELFESLGKKLANDERSAASKMVVRLYTTADQANSQVVDYEFRYCKLKPSKFI
jgi:hypothetical protein